MTIAGPDGGVIGTGAGLIIAGWGSRFIARFLFGVQADPLVYSGVVFTVLIVCAPAGYLPAPRTLRIEPARVLKEKEGPGAVHDFTRPLARWFRARRL